MTADSRRIGLYTLLILAGLLLLALAGLIPIPAARYGPDAFFFWPLYAGVSLLPGAVAYLTRDPKAHHMLWAGVASGAGALLVSYPYCATNEFSDDSFIRLGGLPILAGVVVMAVLSWRRPEWGWRVVGILMALVTGLLLAGGWIASAFCHFSLF